MNIIFTLLKQEGIDVTSDNFWQSGFEVIARAMEDFETTENSIKVG
jgi:oligoendopeptidase F